MVERTPPGRGERFVPNLKRNAPSRRPIASLPLLCISARPPRIQIHFLPVKPLALLTVIVRITPLYQQTTYLESLKRVAPATGYEPRDGVTISRPVTVAAHAGVPLDRMRPHVDGNY